MTEEEIVNKVNEIVSPYGLIAEIPPGVKKVGVKGDARVYQPIIILIGPFPGHDILEEISTKITNNFDISGVNFQTASKDD